MTLDDGIDLLESNRIHRAIGQRVVESRRVRRGYSNNRRWLARLEDGRTVFVKHADDEPTANWLRREHRVYSQLRGDFQAQVLGWYDDGVLPVLVLEDLSGCDWPPPWTPQRIDAVLETLSQVGQHPMVDGLPPASRTAYAERGWPAVARDPEPFLALGLCTPEWLGRALPTVLETADFGRLDGDAVVHLDIRSDNLCFRDDTAIFIDWNHAAMGNREFDLAFWLPSLRLEGGPDPDEVMPDPEPAAVALVAGFFASRACLPPVPVAPLVRDIQLRQLRVALPWMARVLHLPEPDVAVDVAVDIEPHVIPDVAPG